MPWELDGQTYALNMIDTPGHVDFTYEVSLARRMRCDLLVDAAQGIEAQTLANLYLALDNGLIIPVLNKIDLPPQIQRSTSKGSSACWGANWKTSCSSPARPGVGVPELLDLATRLIPPPVGDPTAPARAR
jgi:GTP-binding protein LepA